MVGRKRHILLARGATDTDCHIRLHTYCWQALGSKPNGLHSLNNLDWWAFSGHEFLASAELALEENSLLPTTESPRKHSQIKFYFLRKIVIFKEICFEKGPTNRACQNPKPNKGLFCEEFLAQPLQKIGPRLRGRNLRGQTPICGFLRLPAVFCERLRFPNALFSNKRREYAKISENLRLGSVCPVRVRPHKRGVAEKCVGAQRAFPY